MQYKKALKVLGIGILSSMCIAGCAPQDNIVALYGPAPIETDWDDEEAENEAIDNVLDNLQGEEQIPEKVEEMRVLYGPAPIQEEKEIILEEPIEKPETEIIDVQPDLYGPMPIENTSQTNLEENITPPEEVIYHYEEPVMLLYGPAPIEEIEEGEMKALYGVEPYIDDWDDEWIEEGEMKVLYGVEPYVDDWDSGEIYAPIKALYGVSPRV